MTDTQAVRAPSRPAPAPAPPGKATLALALALALAAAGAAGCGASGGGSSGGATSGSTTMPGTTQGATTATATFLAGASAVDVTPPPGGPLAGFGATPRREANLVAISLQVAAVFGACFDPDPSDEVTFFGRSQGTIDPIMARAVVFSNGTAKAAIVKLDAIATTREVHDDVVAAAASLGIPAANVIVCSTHTHSGPGAASHSRLWQVLASDCFNQRSFERIRDGAIQALRNADAALRPAALGIGTTFETNASRNRRGRPGVFDPEVGVIKVVDPSSGAPIAAVINFAVHGTAFGESNMLYSADVMGACERAIEAGLGGGTALFVNGAEGDVTPSGGLGAGTLLANDLLSVWPSISVKPWVEIRGAKYDLPLPAPVLQTGCLPLPGTGGKSVCDIVPGLSLSIALQRSWLPEKAPFQALVLDRTVLATVPGEPITEIGWEIKRRAVAKGFDRAFVVGLANEHISYIATQAEYFRGEYEGTSTLYGPQTGPMVVDASDAAMDVVKP